MSDIRFCSEHGFFEGDSCSECSLTGVQIIEHNRRERISGFLSGVLRHFAEDYDLPLTEKGWADYTQVLNILQDKYNIDESQLIGIVQMDNKGRYELDNDSIRAVYGHSIDKVSIESTGEENTPSLLYHGTAPRFEQSIKEEGIKPQSRNKVHLSQSKQDAMEVGERHSNSKRVVLLLVDAEHLETDGYAISTVNGDVYTVDEVPEKYIKEYIQVDEVPPE